MICRPRFVFPLVAVCALLLACPTDESIREHEDPADETHADLEKFARTGTLSVLVLVRGPRELALGSVARSADPIGKTTIRRSALLASERTPVAARAGHLRIRVLDESGRLLLTEYVRDPLPDRVEVPPGLGERGGFDLEQRPPFWTKVETAPSSFRVVVPDVKGARRLEFTRFASDGSDLPVGTVDLESPPVLERVKPRSGAGPAEGPRGRAFARVGAVVRELARLVVATSASAQTTYDPDDAEHASVIANGPSAGRFDLLILSDGYLDSNADRAAFNDHVQRSLIELFQLPIYYELRTAMNVHTAFLPSTESGAGDSPSNLKDTPFGAHYDCSSIDRLVCLSAAGRTLAYQVAGDAPGNYGAGGEDAIAVLTNDARYGGGGGAILTFSTNTQSVEILSHEFGHTVIDLADEYESEYDALVASSRTKANISGEISDRNELKWISLVDPATPIPTEEDTGSCTRSNSCSTSTLPAGTAGMYEGGGYTACESYRPTTECQMRCYVGHFCPVCRAAYQDVLGGFAPSVDVYMRDNSLDIGNTPSPTNVEDPPGSGNTVKPWHSVDIVVDAPPYQAAGSTISHENPLAGAVNRVYVTLHNRGTAAAAGVGIELHVAEATGGAPPFPGPSWTLVGTDSTDVAGGEGEATVMFEWNAPADVPEHTCVLALADATGDPLPALSGGLAAIVRGQNNVTWKNLHVVREGSGFSGWISGFWRFPFPMLLRIEAGDAPVGTRFALRVEGDLRLRPFEPDGPRSMTPRGGKDRTYEFARTRRDQRWMDFETEVPAVKDEPFRVPYRLEVFPPAGTGTREILVSVDQLALDPKRRRSGDPIGGNTYRLVLP